MRSPMSSSSSRASRRAARHAVRCGCAAAFCASSPCARGGRVLEVGCGSGVVLRDIAAMVGRRGEAVGVDPSRTILDAARRLSRTAPGARIALRHADGAHLPFTADRFDAALAITVILHVADPLAVVREMARVTRPGGRVGLQDQDFGMLAVTHPDRALTDRIMQGVAAAVYPEPLQRPPPAAPARRRRSAARAAADRLLPGHDARAVDQDLPRAPRRERRALRGGGRGHRPALARWLHRRGGGRHLRAHDDLLRRRRDEARVHDAPGRARCAARAGWPVVISWAAPALAQPKFDGAAALRHVERLVAIGPRVAGTPGGVKAPASTS